MKAGEAIGRLIDEAFAGNHYPVKRKGERRRLNPDLAAITWLELSIQAHTVIHETEYAGDGLRNTFAYGWYGARNKGMHPGPMFKILPLEVTSSSQTPGHNCPDCGDWARTSRCEEHPERGVEGILGRDRNGNAAPRIQPRVDGLMDAWRRAIDELARRNHVVAVRQEGAAGGFTFQLQAEEETTT